MSTSSSCRPKHVHRVADRTAHDQKWGAPNNATYPRPALKRAVEDRLPSSSRLAAGVGSQVLPMRALLLGTTPRRKAFAGLGVPYSNRADVRIVQGLRRM
ncbi:MAG: hypothetical protein QOI01_2596 [Mycobacterium sp.]|jgi:hypothetical protein|nr:hypothetical protein [Mycobacterium sp.]